MNPKQLLDHPLAAFLIVAVFSLIAAVIFAVVGGSVAQVSGQNSLIGTYQAGGAVAGFLIIFAVSFLIIRTLRQDDQHVGSTRRKFVLRFRDGEDPSPTDDNLRCHYRLFNEGWGGWQPIEYTREQGGPTITITEFKPGWALNVRVQESNAAQRAWRSEFHYAGIDSISLVRDEMN